MSMQFASRVLFGCMLMLVTSPLFSASRTFVSAASGSDGNACTRALPCRSFPIALGFTDPGGEIVVLDSGGYGPVVIDRAVAIAVPAGIHAAITAAAGTAIDVSAGMSDTVVVEGLYVNGVGGGYRGIDFKSGARLVIERCVIANFTNSAVGGGPSGGQMYITDTIARDSFAGFIYGTLGTSPIVGTFIRVRAEHTNYGIAPSANAIATVTQSVVSGNVYGFYSGATGSSVLNIDSSVSTFNQYGLYTFGISRVRNSMITQNGIGISAGFGASNVSFGNNAVAGNTTDGAFTTLVGQQ